MLGLRKTDTLTSFSTSPYLRKCCTFCPGCKNHFCIEIVIQSWSNPQSSGRLILRPLSVQQRIRELNLRARHFAETVLAVQLSDGCTRQPNTTQYGHAISLQVWLYFEEIFVKSFLKPKWLTKAATDGIQIMNKSCIQIYRQSPIFSSVTKKLF